MDPIGGKQNVAPKARPTRDRVRTSAPERQTAALKAAAEAAGPRLLQAARAQQLWIAGPRAVEKRGGSARTGGWSKRAVPAHRPRERNEENLLARQRADDCARKAAGSSAGCTRKKRCTFDPACGRLLRAAVWFLCSNSNILGVQYLLRCEAWRCATLVAAS